VVLELYGRSAIRASKRITNPGCYATSTQLLIAPLLRYIKPGAWPTVFAISGYSGAGTVVRVDNDTDAGSEKGGVVVTIPKVTPESLCGGVRPYALTDHIHEREAGHHLTRLLASEDVDVGADSVEGEGAREVKVAFVPAVAPWFSGILSTLSMPLRHGGLSAADVVELYRTRYAGEPLIAVGREVPGLKDVEGRHGWSVGGFQVHSSGDRVVVVVRLALRD
jgi:N-acetyl-gamma-glutamyl-phosphate reductase/acetylglutamate kinase